MTRILLIYQQGMREINGLIHSDGAFSVKLGRQRVPDAVSQGIWGFFSVYVILFLTMLILLVVLSPLDFAKGFSAVAANLNNFGPGLGWVARYYASLPDGARWLL